MESSKVTKISMCNLVSLESLFLNTTLALAAHILCSYSTI